MYILAIDQGTSSTKTIIFDKEGNAVVKGHAYLHTEYFDNGHVEQNPESIYQNVKDSVKDCLDKFTKMGFDVKDISACGIDNQRETFILWNRDGGALTPAIVWACRRSVDVCNKLIAAEQNDMVKKNTGLIIDPYFSGTKLLWLYENIEGLRENILRNEVYFGTVDTWLLYKMTKGKSFKTDYTNAHRTLLFNIHKLKWDEEIINKWGFQHLHLPEVCPSSNYFGEMDLSEMGYDHLIPITAMIGDSHAAAFGEGCYEKGQAKATLGTGCSIMMNTGDKPTLSQNGMLTTICFSTKDKVDFAIEGAIVACGSTIEWLKNELKLFKDAKATSDIALTLKDNAGVYVIPAFSGLGAPHWQIDRKASIEGLTFGSTATHIVRAALESIAYQIKDVMDAMSHDMSVPPKSLAINGGIAQNEFVTSFLVDLLNIPLQKQSNADVSALGSAYLSGLFTGFYNDLDHLTALNAKRLQTLWPSNERDELILKWYDGWKKCL